jgi:hypothetical protein
MLSEFGIDLCTVSPTNARIHKRDDRSNAVVHLQNVNDDAIESDEDHHGKCSSRPPVLLQWCSMFITGFLPSFNLSRHAKKASNKIKGMKRQVKQDSDSGVEFVEPPDVFSAPRQRQGQCYLCLLPEFISQLLVDVESPDRSDYEEEEEEEIPSPSKRYRMMVVTSPPESERDEEEDNDMEEDEEWRKNPVSPRSRFLNRKRVLTSDSEDEGAVTTSPEVRSPRKKCRTKPKVSGK